MIFSIAGRKSWVGMIQEIATTDCVRLNRVKNWAKSAFWMVCLEVDWFDETRRDAFMQALKARGIDTPALFLHDVFDAHV